MPFTKKKKKKLIHQSNSLSLSLSLSLSVKTQRARKLKYRSPPTSWGTVVSDLISAVSSSDYRYTLNSLFVSREKKWICLSRKLPSRPVQTIVGILFVGRERLRSMALRESSSLIWGLWLWILLELEWRSYPLESEVWVLGLWGFWVYEV